MTAARPLGGSSEALPLEIGRYEILGVVGRGGMGVVYRARQRETGALVALKTVPSRAPGAIAAIRREIHALRQLRHPGIVHIVDDGVADGLPWMAMELLLGETLRDRLDARSGLAPAGAGPEAATLDLAPGPAPLDSAVTGAGPAPPRPSPASRLPLLGLLRRLTVPLAHLHAAGLVHRDLKPENIVFRQDGAPVLADLGIVARFGGHAGREEIAADASIAGSLLYMAPEQIRGELVDARADLYALGCILHECLTGAPPFLGRSAAAICQAQLHQQPLPPSAKAEGIPPALDRLVLALLAKRPEDRLGYAEDVACALEALDAGAGGPLPTPRARSYVYRPALAGRASLLGEVDSAIRDLHRERRGALWLLGGESGVGKTRLALEAARRAAQQGVASWVGAAVALGEPLHLFRPLLAAIADRCRAEGAETAARLLGARGKLLARHSPALADLPVVREASEPPPLPPEAARARVLAALLATLLAFAAEAPFLLLLDDLQWADDLSLGLLSSLAAAPTGIEGIFVLGTYRLEERTSELGALLAAPRVRSVELERLGREEVAAMVSGMLALRDPPADLVDFLHRSTDGNPFFIAEYLRCALAEGLVTRDEAGELRVDPRSIVLPFPDTLGALLERRLSALPDAERSLVSWASMLGREVDPPLLETLTGLDEGAMLGALNTLRQAQIFEERADGRLFFVHDKIREIAHAHIVPARRRALHAAVAAALEARAGGSEEQPALIGHHHAEAGDHRLAARHFLRAAERARGAYANGEAIRLYRAALRESGDEVAPALLEPLGDVLGLVGQQEEARQAFGEALERAAGEGPITLARIHRKIGKTWELRHAPGEALAAYARAEAALGAPGLGESAAFWDEWVEVQIQRIAVHYWAARVEEMAAIVERVRPVVEAGGTAAQRARFFRALTQLGLRSERYLPSITTVQHARACLRACEEEEGSPDLPATRFALATVLLWHGALDEAEERLRDALAEAERTGDLTLQARSLTYLTQVWRRRRRVAETRAWATRSLGTARAAEMNDYQGAALANLSWVALEEGDGEEATRLGQEALGHFHSPALVYPFQWMALLPLAAAALGRADLAACARYLALLLDPAQQQLPEVLVQALRAVSEEREESGTARAPSALHQALTRARSLGLL